jgi:UDP-N-acetylglucosamine/UDP-N-acetylgalactosamine diphosphorylase
LPPGDVRFVAQGTLPVLGLDGRILLERPDRVAEAPDGHGGVFAALQGSGALPELESRGIRHVFYHHVDNPLACVADPVYLGLHLERGAEMSCKVVEKRDPLEKVGFLCRRAGRPAVLEYSEVPPELAAAREGSGRLRFWAGSIGIHVLDLAFVRRVAEGPALPLHLARKPVATVDASGRRVEPAEPNGHKLERFVFDALARAGSVAVMEIRREDEYSPLKNARGEASPETARRDLAAIYRRWIAAAGLEALEDGVAIELDHSRFDGPEDLRRSGLRRISEASSHVRIAQGAKR